MSFTVKWYVEKRIIGITISGNITISDLVEMQRQTEALIEQGEQPVHSLIDIRQLGKFPTVFSEIRHALHPMPPVGVSVIITNNRLVKIFTKLITMLWRREYHTFSKFEDGLRFLAEQDDSIHLPTA